MKHIALVLMALISIIQFSNSNATTSPSEAQQQKPQQGNGQADEGEYEDVVEGDFTPEQLARGEKKLAQLYDEKLDANGDGRVTRDELSAWLARVSREQDEQELDQTWRGLYNLSNEDTLDWDKHAELRAAGAATRMQQQQQENQADQQARMQAEVKRAIQEASRETGLDKAGIKVSIPEAPTAAKQEDKEEEATGEDATGQNLAAELAQDQRRWEAADADGDGRLNRREFADFALAEGSPQTGGGVSPKMRRVLALEALERMDADSDGRVSEAEFVDGAPAAEAATEAELDKARAKAREEDGKNFRNVWDANKDGYIDAEEMEKMLDYMDSAPSSPGDEKSSGEDQHASEADELMKMADTDGDGSLSKAEVLARLREFAGSPATNYGNALGIHDEPQLAEKEAKNKQEQTRSAEKATDSHDEL